MTVLHSDNSASVVSLNLVSGKKVQVCVSNITDVTAETENSVTVNGETISWKGAVAVFE